MTTTTEVMHRRKSGDAIPTREVYRGIAAGVEDRQLKDPGVANEEEEEVSVVHVVQLSVIFVVEGNFVNVINFFIVTKLLFISDSIVAHHRHVFVKISTLIIVLNVDRGADPDQEDVLTTVGFRDAQEVDLTVPAGSFHNSNNNNKRKTHQDMMSMETIRIHNNNMVKCK